MRIFRNIKGNSKNNDDVDDDEYEEYSLAYKIAVVVAFVILGYIITTQILPSLADGLWQEVKPIAKDIGNELNTGKDGVESLYDEIQKGDNK